MFLLHHILTITLRINSSLGGFFRIRVCKRWMLVFNNLCNTMSILVAWPIFLLNVLISCLIFTMCLSRDQKLVSKLGFHYNIVVIMCLPCQVSNNYSIWDWICTYSSFFFFLSILYVDSLDFDATVAKIWSCLSWWREYFQSVEA